MAMSSAQEAAWNAGTSGIMQSGQLKFLIMGVLAALMFTFAAWALVQTYRGLSSKSVTFHQFQESLLRLVLLILLTLFFFFS